MSSIRLFSSLSRTKPVWLCRACRYQQQQQLWRRNLQYVSHIKTQNRRYSSQHAPAVNFASRSKRKRRRLLLAATSGAIILGIFNYSDDARVVYNAVQRTGRVLATLALCVKDYRNCLKEKENLSEQDYNISLKSCHQRCADRTLAAMEKNGSIFIKLGQHLTSLEYMLPREWCDTFIPLQDKCPVSSINSIEEMVKNDTGHSISEHFSSFDPVPIGAASLAQVHKAVLRDTGQEVAVKVQHPALDTWSQLDIALTRLTFATVKRFFPDYDLTWLSEELEMSLPQELDFEREGANARRARSYFHQLRNGPPLIIPDVIWARRRILVMEFIAGRRIDDLAYLNTQGIDRGDVSAALAYIFNEMIFGTNAPLHCDPHAGNIAVRHNPKRSTRNFDIILYDHGLYRDIPPQLRVSYAQLWLAVLDGDEERMRRYAAEAAGVTDEYFPLFASAITGRDYKVVKGAKSGGGVATPRTAAEIEVMSGKMDNSLFIELVQLLGRMPRIILLILKTNDLTRSLDASLQTHDGAIRNFLILARFASRAVLDEELRRWRGDTSDNSRMTEPVNNHDTKSSLYTKTPYEPKNVNLNPKTDIKPSFLFRILPLHGFGSVFSAWVGHVRVVALLNVYEFWLHLRSFWVRAFT